MLKQHAWEIYQIAKENHVDRFIAADMFIANVRNAGDEALPHYPGAEVDYAALKEPWEALFPEQQNAEKVEYNRAVRANETALSKAWQAGDRAAFAQAVMEV